MQISVGKPTNFWKRQPVWALKPAHVTPGIQQAQSKIWSGVLPSPWRSLAPRKMRFNGESQGMVLAAGDGTGIYHRASIRNYLRGMRIK
jgi:tRNA-binding EMAP/Myf-like protein